MKNLLLYKMILFNSLIAAWGIGTSSISERIATTFAADSTGISYLIVGFFLVTFVGTMFSAWNVNRRMNMYSRGEIPDIYRGNLWTDDIEWIAYAGGWMLFLGLIGTLLGLQISLEGVNTGNMTIEGVKTLAVKMIQGLRIELSATIVGAAACMWTEMNYVLVRRESVRLSYHESNLIRFTHRIDQ
jgi:hypothetical protein